MKIILKYLGGSHSYGLNTPDSDRDERGIFINTEAGKILGLNRFDHQQDNKDGKDSMLFEVRNFLNLLRKGNTQALEAIYLSQNQLFSDSTRFSYEYLEIKEKIHELIDTNNIFKSLMGYIDSERQLMIGKRTGKLGGKRYEQVVKLGFSPKNAVQLIRLSWAGAYFFENKIFPVKVSDYNKELHDFLMGIKTHPEDYRKEQLIIVSYEYEAKLNDAFSYCNFYSKFDESVANEMLKKFYLPFLK